MLALIPLALQLVPALAKWLIGPKAGSTTSAIVAAIQGVTGSDDPAVVAQKLAADAQLQVSLQVQLAQIAADHDREERRAEIDEAAGVFADRANARNQTVSLAESRSAIAFGAPIVSALVLVTFAVVLFLTIYRPVPSGSETILNMMLGTLAAMTTAVVSYWVGSSAGSVAKSDTIERLTNAAQNSTPQEVVDKLLPPVSTPVPVNPHAT